MKRYSVASLPLMALAAAGLTVASTDRRVEERVDSRIRAQVAAVVDSLVDEGVPAELLIQYALEGTSKRGSPEVIITGVRKWARDLRRARQLLGPNASALEVSAGAQAIRAGVEEAQLERFRNGKREQRYASAMSTMAYLISKGVPADTAANVLINVALASASDAEIRTLQDEIERDINGGTPPGMAAVARERGLLDALEAGRSPSDGVAPGAALPSTRGTARPADPMANGTLKGSAVGNKSPAPRGKDIKRP